MWNMLVKIPECFIYLDASYVYQSMDLTNDKPSDCKIRATLKDFKWEVFPRPPYFPDLAPCDYDLFRELKGRRGGKHFSSEAELDAEILLFFSKIDPLFYRLRIEKLVSCYNECLDLLGEYVEK